MLNGERVKLLRVRRGWSVAQLALQAGMTRDGVHKIESGGRVGASAASAAALARALETTSDFLLGLTDTAARPDTPGPAVPPELLQLLDRLSDLAPERRARLAHLFLLILDLDPRAPADRPR